MTVGNLNGLTSPKDGGKDVYCCPFFSMYFSPLRYMPSWYASVRTHTSRDLVHLEEDLEKDLGEDGVEVEPLTCVRRSVWGMHYANDAGLVPKSAEGLAKIMIVVVTVLEAAGLTVSETKTETMLRGTHNQVLPTSPLIVEATGQRYMQTM